MKKLQILIIEFLISLSICAFASMQAKSQTATIWTDKADRARALNSVKVRMEKMIKC